MGSLPARYAPYALAVGIAVVGVFAVFAIFNNPAKGQYLNASIDNAARLARISNVRIGEHPDKTRIVIDISHPTDLSYKVSEDGKTIRLNLPRAVWQTGMSLRNYTGGNIIGFKPNQDLKGGNLILQSDIPVKIKRPFFVSPSGKRGHRIVVDITPFKINSNKKRLSTLVASLDNSGALPQENIQISQLSYSQNPYIQRAFPRTKKRPQSIGPQKKMPIGRTLHGAPSRPINMQRPRNQRTPYRSPAQPSNQQNQTEPPSRLEKYTRGTVAMQMIDEISNEGNGTYDQEYDPGFILSGALGAKLDNGFRAEGELVYANSTLKKISGTWNGRAYNTEQVQGDLSSTALMGNLIYDFPSSTILTPYAMAGVGFSLLSLNDLVASNNAISNDMDVVAAMQIGAGFSYDIDRRTKLDIGYRYFETQNPEFSDSTGTPFMSTFASHNFLVGARVNLN